MRPRYSHLQRLLFFTRKAKILFFGGMLFFLASPETKRQEKRYVQRTDARSSVCSSVPTSTVNKRLQADRRTTARSFTAQKEIGYEIIMSSRWQRSWSDFSRTCVSISLNIVLFIKCTVDVDFDMFDI